jgi:hypothetical protein
MITKKLFEHKYKLVSAGILSLIIFSACSIQFTRNILFSTFCKPTNNIEITSTVLPNSQFISNFRSFNPVKRKTISNQYKAIRINIKNQSNKEYVIDKNSLNLALVSPQKIKRELSSRNFLGPIIAAGITASLCIFTFGLAYIPSVIAGATVGASTNLIDVKSSNNKLQHNLQTRCHDLTHPISIQPYESVNTIFFIKKENMKPKYTIKIFNVTDNKKLERVLCSN